MTSLETDLDTAVGSAYSVDQKAAALVTSLRYASGLRHETVSDGDSLNSDLAVMLFATEILFNERKHKQSQKDNTVVPQSLEQMWSKQMNDLLFTDVSEKSIILKNDSPSQFAPGQRWQDGGSRANG